MLHKKNEKTSVANVYLTGLNLIVITVILTVIGFFQQKYRQTGYLRTILTMFAKIPGKWNVLRFWISQLVTL